jgi:hypothetical protein
MSYVEMGFNKRSLSLFDEQCAIFFELFAQLGIHNEDLVDSVGVQSCTVLGSAHLKHTVSILLV